MKLINGETIDDVRQGQAGILFESNDRFEDVEAFLENIGLKVDENKRRGGRVVEYDGLQNHKS